MTLTAASTCADTDENEAETFFANMKLFDPCEQLWESCPQLFDEKTPVSLRLPDGLMCTTYVQAPKIISKCQSHQFKGFTDDADVKRYKDILERMRTKAGKPANVLAKYAAKAFQSPFLGRGMDGVTLFKAYLQEHAQRRPLYREIKFVQSSGSGKTRIVSEVLEQSLGILMPGLNMTIATYPYHDWHIDDLLELENVKGKGNASREDDRRASILLLVCVTLECLATHLTAFAVREESKTPDLYRRACEALAKRLQYRSEAASVNERSEIIANIAAGTERYLKESERHHTLPPLPDLKWPVSPIDKNPDEGKPKEWTSSTTKEMSDKEREDPVKFQQYFCHRRMLISSSPALRNSVKRLKYEHCLRDTSDTFHILIGFDELRLRGGAVPTEMGKMFSFVEKWLSATRRANGWPATWNIFFPMLSTNSTLAEIQQSGPKTPSFRPRIAILQPPFVACPSDVTRLQSENKMAPRIPLEEMPKYEHIHLLGRPLWTYVQDAHDGYLLAWQKLFNVEAESAAEGMEKLTEEQWLAMLSHRVHLVFRPSNSYAREEQQMALAKQVDKHLRQVVHISKSRAEVFSVASSEPLLSHVAFEAWLLSGYHQSKSRRNKSILVNAIQTMRDTILKWSGSDAGDVGELAAQLLILSAVDTAKLAKFWRMSPRNPKFDAIIINSIENSAVDFFKQIRCDMEHIVTVSDFLEALLMDEYLPADTEAKDKAGVVGRPAFHAFFKSMEDYRFYLTHFIQVESADPIGPEYWEGMAQRGLGCLMPRGYAAIDIMFPVFHKTDGTIKVVNVQVKNTEGKVPSDSVWPSMECMMKLQADAQLLNIFINFSRGTQKPQTPFEFEEHGQSYRLALRGVSGSPFRAMQRSAGNWSEFLNVHKGNAQLAMEQKSTGVVPYYFEGTAVAPSQEDDASFPKSGESPPKRPLPVDDATNATSKKRTKQSRTSVSAQDGPLLAQRTKKKKKTERTKSEV